MGITEIMPKSKNVYGVWLSHKEDCDVHVIIERDVVVIGVNPDYRHQTCSNPALILSKDICELQYKDGQDVKYKKLDPVIVALALEKFLKELKDC